MPPKKRKVTFHQVLQHESVSLTHVSLDAEGRKKTSHSTVLILRSAEIVPPSKEAAISPVNENPPPAQEGTAPKKCRYESSVCDLPS